MKSLILATLAATAVPSVAIAHPCSQDGPDGPAALHSAWIMDGWERRAGDPNFVFARKMSRYYDLEDTSGVFYDNFAPGETQLFRNSAIYGANWEALQNEAETVRHGLTTANEALVSDSVASTTLGFVGQIDRKDGKVIAFDGRSVLGWACTANGWKIKHELNYAWPVEPEEIADKLGKFGTDE